MKPVGVIFTGWALSVGASYYTFNKTLRELKEGQDSLAKTLRDGHHSLAETSKDGFKAVNDNIHLIRRDLTAINERSLETQKRVQEWSEQLAKGCGEEKKKQ